MGDASEEKRRAAWGYEPNTPTCATCSKYRKARIAPKGRIEPPFCAGGKFVVHASGCCDRWKDKKTGEGLERWARATVGGYPGHTKPLNCLAARAMSCACASLTRPGPGPSRRHGRCANGCRRAICTGPYRTARNQKRANRETNLSEKRRQVPHMRQADAIVYPQALWVGLRRSKAQQEGGDRRREPATRGDVQAQPKQKEVGGGGCVALDEMRTIIAGSRSVTDLAEVEAAVRECGWWPTVILSGRAPGADMLGEAWAGAYGIAVEPYPADWAAEPRTAGHTRNTLMADRADALVAVWDGHSAGTRDMIAKAQARGLRVHVRTVAGAAVPPPPMALDTLLAGTRLPAGLTYSTVIPDLDFETFSQAGHRWDAARERWAPPPGAKTKGLGVVGAAVYSEDPTCEVLCLHYDLKDGKGRRGWRPGAPLPADLFDHIARGGLLEAWNVGFERWIWRNVCVARMGWPAVRPEQWRCAMAKSRAHAGPGKLEVFGEVFALATRKDSDGKRLLDKFSVPRNPTKADKRMRVMPLWEPADVTAEALRLLSPAMTPGQQRKVNEDVREDHADALRLYSYNETDIASEAEASAITPDLSDDELAYWQDDQTINARGVRIDLAGVEDCIAIIEQALKRYGDELEALAGCQPTELQQLKGWLHAQGVHLDSMDEDAVEAALKGPLPDQARRALEIRAAVGSASVKKVYAMRNSATLAGRLHDLYTYHGARTGRCIAAGQMVLVKALDGAVLEAPIEQVRLDDLVWDGARWVAHGGVASSGAREVVTYASVVATPDHQVFVSPERAVPLAEAAAADTELFTGEAPCPLTFTQ